MIYNYTKAIASDRLAQEIKDSAITVALDNITANGESVTISFKANLSTEENTILNNIVESHVPTNLPVNMAQTVKVQEFKLTPTGRPQVAAYEPEGDSSTIVSHNFCDPCSWYQHSLFVDSEIIPPMTSTLFKSQSANWIDLESGRIYDEDNIMVSNANKYRPIIKVDGVVQTSGHTIDFPKGEITFDQAPTGQVTASYYKADKSYFVIRPKAGKTLAIKAAEIQFGVETVLSGPMVFEVWVGSTPIPGTRIAYKNFRDFVSACNEGQGLIPKIGDLASDVHVFPFNYARPKPLKSSQGVEVRVYCHTHAPCTGTYATATFYVLEEDET